MFGGLRKKLNDVWSGADFWDEEENRAQRVQAAKPTVQTRPVQAPKAPPVRTINARQNNARAIDQSYGSGFDRFVNKSRDMFDANTQADRIRRFATTGIDESYDQQQRKQTIAAQTNPEKRSLLEQVGYNVMGAQAEIAKVPSASQKLVGTALKSDNPIIKMGTSRFLDQNPFTGTLNSIDTVLPGSKKTAGKALQSFGANNEKLITNKLEQSRFGQKESDNKLVAGVSRALGQLSSQIGANVVAPGSGAAIGSVPLASSEYDKAKQSGKTDDQALGIAGLQGTVAAGLEQVGLGRLGKGAGTRLVKGLRNFATEGSTEGIQQFGQNLVANKAYNPNQGLTEGVKESVLYGGIAGGVAGSVMGGNKPKRPTTNLVSKPQPIPQPNLNRNEVYTLSDQQEVNLGRIKDPRTVNAVSRDAFNIAKRSGIDITSGSPREINDRINSVLEQPQNSRRFFKPLDQRGSIQVPGGKDVDPLESLKQEARKLDEQVRSYDTKKNFRGFRESDDARKLVELESKLQDSNKTISRLENPVDKVTVSQIENMGRKAILEGSVSKADLVKQFNKMGKEKFPSNQKRYIDDTYGSVEAYYDDVIAKGEAGVVENFSQLAGVPTSPQFEDFYNRTVLNRNKTGLNGNEPKINKVERKITETEPKRTEKATQPQPPKSPIESLKQEAKRLGYDKGYTEEGQIANTIDELMKEQNAVREVGIPLYDKYKNKLDGTKTVTEMMTPAELKAYRAAEAKSEKASKLLKDYFDYKKGNSQSQPPKSTAEPKFERDINTGKMKMQSSSKPVSKEKYSIANSDITRTKSPGMNQDGFTVEDWGGKKRYVSLDDASPETKLKVRRAEAEYEQAKMRKDGSAMDAKRKVNDAYSDAINDLKLQDYATTDSGGRTFNSKYNDWLETKYKDRNVDSATIKDMATNPQKYRSQFEAETATQPPKPTAKAAESKTPLEVEQELDKFYGRGGDQEFLSSVIKKYESKKDGKKSIAEMMNPEERARYDQIFSGSSSEQPAQRTNESNKGVVLSEATLADGTKQQKVLGAPGEGKVKTSSPLSDQAYKEVFGSDINVDSEPRFDAVAAGSKSNSTKRLMEAISQDEMLTQAAAQAQQDGKEINFFAKKDRNGRSVGIERFDPRYHKIEAGFVTDKNGNVLGNHIKVDETGMQVNVGGDVVNMDTVLGNPQDWEGHYEMSSTMERNIYENAPNKEIADKTYKFVVANKIKHEAELKTDLANQRKALNERTRATLKAKPRGVSKKEYKADVFDFIEGNMSQSDLVGKYGPQTSQQIISYKNDTRRLYDTLLDRVNTTFEQFGEASVPRRKGYITHINELISKPSFAGELYGQLQNSFLGEGQTQTRGEVPANIAGRTENFEPRKKWNRFFQARRGGEFTKDPFKAVDAYLEPTLYNIHMTEPAVRARAVEAAFRTAREIKETDTKHLTDEFNTSLEKYKSGNGGGDLVTGFQEYANAVTGKTQRLDRQIIDQGSKSRLALHGWQKLQAIGGRATILGNVSSVLAQPLNQVGTVAQSGPINYMKGLAASVGGDKTIEQSPFITARRTKVDSMFKSRGQKVLDAGGVPLQLVEMASVEQSWNAIHQKVKSEGYTGKDAILETDRRTERTVAGRGIADKPELYRSTVYNGVLQYTLEVNASNKQFWRDLNPRQKATFLVASTGMNMLMEAVTGYEPLPDFLGAMIDTAGDFLDEEDDASALGKGARGVQRMFGEYVSQNPIASATANILPQNLRKDIFGKDAQVSRFEGTAAPVQVVKNVVNAGSSLAKGQLTNARDSALKVAPFGNQAKKTITGAEMLARGYAVNAKGEKTFDAPTSPVGKSKALLFGPNSSGEARQYYDKKNGVTKSSTPSKTSGDLGEYGDVKNVLKAQFDTKEGREFLAMNAAEKKEAAKNDTGIRQMYEQYNTTKRVNKASPDRPAGLAKNYETFLNGHAKRTPEQRERLAYSQNDYDLKLAEAKYEEDKLKGKVSRAEKINRDYTIKKAQVGAKFSKDVRESYNSLSKAELTALAESDPNGQKIWDDAVAYGDALVEAGLLKKNKLKTKSKGGGKGRRKGKGRGGKGGRGGKRASKYDYTKDLFGSGGNIDSNNNTKALRAILAKAMSGKS